MQTRWASRRALGSALIAALWAAGCGESSNTAGEAVYSERLEDGNTFTCATCHALTEPAADGFRRPGHPLGDATRRPSFKNGRFTELRSAVNSCVTEWMNATALSEFDPRWRALRGFLEQQPSGTTAPAVIIAITPPPSDLSGGDADAGRELFDHTCAVCHGLDAVGTRQAPPLVGPALDADYIARRVRTSGPASSPTYDGLSGGIMPFWGSNRLSDAELLDIVAYVERRSGGLDGGVTDGSAGDAGVSDGGADDSGADSAMGDAGPDGSASDSGAADSSTVDSGAVDSGPSGCASTHAKIGQTATLITRFHGTVGTATIVDDCTIRVDGFSYDGTGIDVRFYGGLAGNYNAGFAISGDLLRSGGYSGETLTLRLPAGRTLDELDGLSLWCVDVGVSFGDAMFL